LFRRARPAPFGRYRTGPSEVAGGNRPTPRSSVTQQRD